MRARPSAPERSTMLYEGELVRIGRFDCDDGDPAWRETNTSGPWPLLAFPGTPVEIQHDGRAPVVANANCVMLYNAQQPYRRRLLDRSGDHCVFVSIAPALLEETIATVDPAVHDRGSRMFTADRAPSDARLAMAPVLLARHLSHADVVDPLFVDERLVAVVRAVVSRTGAPLRDTGDPSRHTELVRAIERDLSLRFASPATLAEIARRAGCSPFHAARVFRARVGTSIHAYRHRLRLHAALHALADGRDIAELALDMGFASHSHFTEAVRRAFGAPPSYWRGRLDHARIRALVDVLWQGRPRARSRKRDAEVLR